MRTSCLGYNSGWVLMFLLLFNFLLLLVIWVLQHDGKLGAWARLGWLLEARDDGVIIRPVLYRDTSSKSGTVPCNSTYLPTLTDPM
jgi:hypothetical protein